MAEAIKELSESQTYNVLQKANRSKGSNWNNPDGHEQTERSQFKCDLSRHVVSLKRKSIFEQIKRKWTQSRLSWTKLRSVSKIWFSENSWLESDHKKHEDFEPLILKPTIVGRSAEFTLRSSWTHRESSTFSFLNHFQNLRREWFAHFADQTIAMAWKRFYW